MSWSIAAAAVSALVAGAAAQAVPALPVATAIGTTGYCTLEEGWEYAQRWNFPDNQVSTMTMEECAELCAEHELCTGATFLDYPDNTDKKNCWMKSWASPPAPAGTPCFAGPKADGKFVYNAIILSTGATCADLTFAEEPIDCETDSMLEEGADAVLTPKTVGQAAVVGATTAAPLADVPASAAEVAPVQPVADAGDVVMVATAAGEYVGYNGYDYIPSDEAPTAVTVVDVGNGLAVETEEACAEACDAEVGCNAASYYGMMPEADWPAKKNCWLKTIGTPCELPVDAEAKPLAILLMKVSGEDCPIGMGAAGPTAAIAATGPSSMVATGPVATVDPIAGGAAIAPDGVSPLATAPAAAGASPIEAPPSATGPVSARDFDAATTGDASPASGSETTAVVSFAPHGASAAAFVGTIAAAGALLL